MNIIRGRLKKRLLILVAGLLLLSVVGTGAYVYRKRQINAQFMQLRKEGLAAARAGDHRTAVDRLGPYLARHVDDQEALVQFVRSRPLVKAPKGQHLLQTITALRYLLQQHPERTDDRRALLRLYADTGYVTETVETANALPKDAEVLGYLTRALTQLHHFDQALVVAQQWSEKAPADYGADMSILYLMRQTQKPSEQIIRYAEAKSKKQTAASKQQKDRRWELVLGYARILTGSPDKAATHMRSAAQGDLIDEEYGVTLLEQLDRLGAVADGEDAVPARVSVLERLSKVATDPEVKHTIAQRFFEMARYGDVAELLKDLDPADALASVEILSLRALSLKRLDRAAEAVPIQKALAGRQDDPDASVWVVILAEELGQTDPDGRRLAEACQAALARNDQDGYVHYYLGEAYHRLGEPDRAVVSWQRAAQLRGSWTVPVVRIADSFADNGRYVAAVGAAREAYRRDPRDVAARLTLYRVWAAGIEGGWLDGTAELLGLVEEVQTQAPGEPQTLAIKVGLLGRSAQAGDRAKAEELLKAALAGPKPMSEQILLHMAATSRAAKLGLEEKCFERAERDHGMTVALAYAKAVDRFAAGRADDGMKVLQSTRPHLVQKDQVAWQMAHARYLDLTRQPAALEAVRSLAESRPGDLQVQQFALNSPAALGDREFYEKLVGRVRSQTGDAAIGWRVARARWLLRFDAAVSDRGAAGKARDEAIGLLKEVVRTSPQLAPARLLLADALESAEDLSGAIEHLTAAAELDPGSSALALRLVKLLQLNGDFQRSREWLERIGGTRLADPEQRRQAAIMMARQGESQRAIELLEESSGQRESDLVLASLYRLRQQPAKAEAIFTKLLEKPDEQSVAFAADFYASQGRTKEADATLAILDRLNVKPGVKQLHLADHTMRYGGADEAAKLYQAATVADPTNPRSWKALIACHLSAGRVAQARATVDAASKALPGDGVLQPLAGQKDLLGLAADPGLRPCCIALLRGGTDSTAAVETLRVILDARAAGLPTDQVAQRLADLTVKFPRFSPLQMFLAQTYLDLKRLDAATAVAARAVEASPGALEPVRLAANIYAAAEHWAEALDAARRWREQLGSDPLAADLLIAESCLQLNKPAEAIRQLEPHVRAADNDPAKASHPGLFPAYLRAMEISGKSGEVAAVVEELLKKDFRWRQLWVGFVISSLDEARAAAWLERLVGMAPADSESDHILLAEGWSELAKKWGDAQYNDRSRAVLRPLAEAPDASPLVLSVTGIREEQDGNFREAERLYRKALERGGDVHVAQNNLAMLLVRQNRKLDEAMQLVSAAAQAQPGQPAVHDTLASVKAKRGDLNGAMSSLNKALQLAPGNVEYQVHLAEVLTAAGRSDDALRVLGKANAYRDDADRMPQELRTRVEELRERIARPQPGRAAAAR